MDTAIITGIFTLAGVFLGAYMQRITQRQKWLLETRAKVFAEFLHILAKCQENAAHCLKAFTPQERKNKKMLIEQKLIDIFDSAFVHAKIVRFFVDENGKERIEKLVSEIYALHASYELGDQRHKTITKKVEKLQQLVENNLKKLKWP